MYTSHIRAMCATVLALILIACSSSVTSSGGTGGSGGHGGACDTGCPSFPHVKYITDVDGGCVFAGCENLWGDCNDLGIDGCETDLTTDATCGNCHVACALPEHCVSTCDGNGMCLTGCQ